MTTKTRKAAKITKLTDDQIMLIVNINNDGVTEATEYARDEAGLKSGWLWPMQWYVPGATSRDVAIEALRRYCAECGLDADAEVAMLEGEGSEVYAEYVLAKYDW
jgi:hypothetical protein